MRAMEASGQVQRKQKKKEITSVKHAFRSTIKIQTFSLELTSPAAVLVLGCAVLLLPLAAGLVNFDQQVFDILDFTFYRLRLVPQLPVPPFQTMELFLQRVELCPLPLAIPAWE